MAVQPAGSWWRSPWSAGGASLLALTFAFGWHQGSLGGPMESQAVESQAAVQDPKTKGPSDATGGASIGRLHPDGAFFYPEWAAPADEKDGAMLGNTSRGPIQGLDYLRYLAATYGTRHVDDMVFDLLLAAECRARNLAGAAVVLARGTAALRLKQSGRTEADDPDGALRQRFANDAMRQLRIDALVQAARQDDPAQVQAVFDHRYGVDGVRVEVAQVLVSFAATANRTGHPEQSPECAAAAAQRVAQFAKQLTDGAATWEELLHHTDDRTTRRRLRDPDTAAGAGLIPNYNYDRYGDDFAAVVRSLEEGAHGVAPSPVGYHLIRIVDRTTTRFEDVEDEVRMELRSRPVTPASTDALRRALFEGYNWQPAEGR